MGCSFVDAADWLFDLPAYAFWFSVCASSFCVRAAVLELAGPLGRTVLEGKVFALGVVAVLDVVVCVEVDFACDPEADTEPTKPTANRKIEPVRSSFFIACSLSPCSTTAAQGPSCVSAIYWPTRANQSAADLRASRVIFGLVFKSGISRLQFLSHFLRSDRLTSKAHGSLMRPPNELTIC